LHIGAATVKAVLRVVASVHLPPLEFAVAMLGRRRRAALIGRAILAGSIIGFIRIGQGGHFLSDVVFAGVFMALSVALLH
jgi:lipid A 4'-phosphatase